MKQIAQPIHGGRARVVDVPAPALRPGGVIVETAWSLISAGTDRMTIDLAGKSLAGKARSRPDQLKKVLSKVKTEGLASTLTTVRARLTEDLGLGYSLAGRVVAVGRGAEDLRVGQEVACAGMGAASHAELNFVPRNLVAPVPKGLPLRHAATVTLGAIALQGVRRAEVVLGERVGVVGLGLLGLLTVQMLRSAGCHVFAVDLDPEKVELAKALGAEAALVRDAGNVEEKARTFGEGHGLDAVLVTAATESNDPAVLAAGMSRLGGRVVIVGAVGMDLPRRVFYDKELDLRLARSYGPGRYDPTYEEHGRDYPYPYVRFTEGRNMSEYLALLGRGDVDVEPLLTRQFSIEEGARAYEYLMSEESRSAIGLLFAYPEGVRDEEYDEDAGRLVMVRKGRGSGGVGIGLIGAGAYARSVLMPALERQPDYRPTGIVTTRGLTALNGAKNGGFRFASTRIEDVLEDEHTDAVVIATRHRDHARIAVGVLRAGKDVFVEKPLALTLDELAEVDRAVNETGRLLVVGFNRRFAPTARELKRALAGRSGPLHMVYRVNAGPIPEGHWTRDLTEGGGRILGEVCHFVDLLLFFAGVPPESVHAYPLPEDGVSATIRFADGSVGSVDYAVSGDTAIPKERIEVFGDGTAAVIDNFRALTIASGGRAKKSRAAAGKGQRQEVRAFLDAVRGGGASPVPYEQASWSTRLTLAIEESAASGEPVKLPPGGSPC